MYRESFLRPRRACLRAATALLSILCVAGLLSGREARSATPRAAATLHYQLVDIGVPDGALGAFATGVNASGQVVGYWRQNGTTPIQGFLWDAAHGMRTLTLLAGDLAALPSAINDSGEVAGLTASGNGDVHAVLWDAAGTPHNLGTLGGNNSVAAGINNPTAGHGTQVVGTSRNAGGHLRPFIWDAQHGIRDIGPTDPQTASFDSHAWAINDAGQVTGDAFETVGSHQYVGQTFLWSEQLGLQDLDPTTQPSIGYDINASGVVVGQAFNENFQLGVTFWDGGGQHFRGDLLLSFPMDEYATLIRPLGVNAAGDVAYTEANGGGNATVVIGGVAHNLNPLTTLPEGSILKSATDINDAGQIVGDFYSAADSRRHAYLLTPGAAPVVNADLQVTQSASTNSVQTGQNVTFTVTVKNNGPDASSGGTLTDTLPTGGTFVSANPAAGASGGQVQFTLPALAKDASAIFSVTVQAASAGTLTNTAAATGANGDPTPGNNSASSSVTVTQAPPPASADLSVTLTATPNPVLLGKPVTCTATVTNHGPQAAHSVQITPSFSGAAQAAISVGTVNPNQTVAKTFTVTPTEAGALSLSVVVGGAENDPNGADNTAGVSVTVQATPPAPAADLTGSWSALKIGRSGSARKPIYTLTGTLTVSNAGTLGAPATKAAFYVSADGTLDAGDPQLRTTPSKPVLLTISALGAKGARNSSKAYRFSFKLPTGVNPSTLVGLYVIAKIDPDGSITESSKANNLVAGGPVTQ